MFSETTKCELQDSICNIEFEFQFMNTLAGMLLIRYKLIFIAFIFQVTGANKGIGYGIVKGLCEKYDGTVYLTARNVKRGEAAVAELKKVACVLNVPNKFLDTIICSIIENV